MSKIKVKVKVKQGIVRGCEEKLPDGRSFFRFSGIPYAKQPINELRFRSPQKLLKFDKLEIDCTREGDACFHKSTLTRDFIGSEDCLNLNVYVPASADSSTKLTVMIYIHGGGFKYYSGSKDLFSPEHLLMEDVIVVTVNYRFHILGFLSLPSMGISGNAGLKDQQMALEWVHENIASFNGDQNNICLFGESAGSVCTHLHTLNEKSRGFINSAICQSGSAYQSSSFRGNTDRDVREVAKILGCQSDSFKDVYDKLLNATVKELYDNCEKNPSLTEQQSRFRRWRLVIEEDSPDAFITASTFVSMAKQSGKINFPIIFGTNDGDGMPKVAENLKNLKDIDASLERFIPKVFKLNEVDSNLLARRMKKFYFGDEKISQENLPKLVTFFTDIMYMVYQMITNKFMDRYQPGCKRFLYEFQFDGKLNIQKRLVKLEHLPVAGHADDVFYLFGGVLADKIQLTPDSREFKMRKLMCKLWTNFAKYDDPTPDHDNPLDFKWTPVEPTEKNSQEIDYDYLVINGDMKMVKNLNKDRMDFWRENFKKWVDKSSFTSTSKL